MRGPALEQPELTVKAIALDNHQCHREETRSPASLTLHS